MKDKPVYLIGDIWVKNPTEYAEYVEKVTPVAEKYGGKYLIRGGRVDVMEKQNWNPKRIVLIRFPNIEKAIKWYECEEYQPIKSLRIRNSKSNIVFVEGID
mgnify:CR=1 FL=1|tara:strand:- start:19 stop:321 length:303 start_codon:yes stop_codon:yes gene_type:complete